jgi:hypothetical protein
MKIIMGNRHNKFWFIFLLIIGIYASITHSYGDFESLNDYDDDTTMSQKVNFESLIGSMNARHRVRRAAAVAMTTDIFTSKCFMF